MKPRIQFAGCLLALGISVMAAPSFGQRANWAQNREDNKPPKEQRQQQRQQQRREQGRQQRQERRQQQDARRAQSERRQNENTGRPPERNLNRAQTGARSDINPNRPPSAYTPPPRPQKTFRDLGPEEKRKVIENNNRLRNLPPAQRQEMLDRGRVWGQMTREQQDHVRNEVVPKWRQMPPDRRRAIQQRLGVLQNMPESARNQHLSDPNFTRGMNEEDKAMLRDLSHLHVGGAPDPPNE